MFFHFVSQHFSSGKYFVPGWSWFHIHRAITRHFYMLHINGHLLKVFISINVISAFATLCSQIRLTWYSPSNTSVYRFNIWCLFSTAGLPVWLIYRFVSAQCSVFFWTKWQPWWTAAWWQSGLCENCEQNGIISKVLVSVDKKVLISGFKKALSVLSSVPFWVQQPPQKADLGNNNATGVKRSLSPFMWTDERLIMREGELDNVVEYSTEYT